MFQFMRRPNATGGIFCIVAYTVYERGERGGDPSAAFWQLMQPNPNNPTFIISLEPSLGLSLLGLFVRSLFNNE